MEFDSKLFQRSHNLFLGLLDAAQDDVGRLVLHLLPLDLLVLVDGEYITVLPDLVHRYQETLVLTGTGLFCLEVGKASNDIRDVILCYLGTLLVQGETVGLHIVKPHFVCAAGIGLGEDQDGGGNTGIRLEHAGRHGYYGLQALVIHQLLTESFVGFAVAK